MALVRFGSIKGDKELEPRTPLSNLTDLTDGTVDGALEKVRGSSSRKARICNDNFAELNAKLNEVISALKKCNWVTGS